MSLLPLILVLALQPASAALPADAVNDMRRIHADFRDAKEKWADQFDPTTLAHLVAGAAMSGKSVDEVYQDFQAMHHRGGFIPDEVGYAVLAAAAARSNMPGRRVLGYFQSIYPSLRLTSPGSPLLASVEEARFAPIAAAAAMFSRSPDELAANSTSLELQHAYFKDWKGLGWLVLAKTASGYSDEKLLEIFDLFHPEAISHTRKTVAAILTAAMVMSGRNQKEMTRIYMSFLDGPKRCPFECAAALAYGTALSPRTGDHLRVDPANLIPAGKVEPGQHRAAEDLFHLNWHGGRW